MRRREFITLLGGAAAAWPLAVASQGIAYGACNTDRRARIAQVSFLGAAVAQTYHRAFRDGLSTLGWVEGCNIAVEQRFAEGEDERLPAIVDEILAIQPEVIAIDGARVVHAFRARGAPIPIVTTVVSDPIGPGFIASFARPGGNITGLAFQDAELITKRAELLKELVPGAGIIAYLVNPSSSGAELFRQEAERNAAALRIKARVLNASTEHDLDEDFASLTQMGAGGLVVSSDSFLDSRHEHIAALSARYRIPAILTGREFVLTGGLMSYGPSLPDSYRRAALYVGRILKGDKAADLPVMQPEKYDLVINQKTAKALGLTIPSGVLAIADEVIE